MDHGSGERGEVCGFTVEGKGGGVGGVGGERGRKKTVFGSFGPNGQGEGFMMKPGGPRKWGGETRLTISPPQGTEKGEVDVLVDTGKSNTVPQQ